MNNQVLFASVLLLSVSVAILFYQNIKLSRKLDQELGSVNRNMTDMSKMIALNNNINLTHHYKTPLLLERALQYKIGCELIWK